MRINKIYYRTNLPVGGGVSENFTFEVEPEENDSVEDCFRQLREWAKLAKVPTENEVYHKLSNGHLALKQLEQRIEEKKEQWEEIRAFLIAQGINPNAPEMPLPLKVLPQAIDGEVVEKDI